MYCPYCATRLPTTATHCHACDRTVQLPGHPLVEADLHRVAQVERWKHQRHRWGLLLVMCSLLVGCFIPIALGLFSGFAHLTAVILVLAGLAGVLLLVGSMLLMAADNTILVADDGLSVSPDAVPRRAQTGETTRLFGDRSEQDTFHIDYEPSPVRR